MVPPDSVDAVHERETVDAVTPVTTRLVGTDGVIVFEAVTVIVLLVPTFPAASYALAERVCVPFVLDAVFQLQV
jgi:hypothetical protein